jgi:hypothetical protein
MLLEQLHPTEVVNVWYPDCQASLASRQTSGDEFINPIDCDTFLLDFERPPACHLGYVRHGVPDKLN